MKELLLLLLLTSYLFAHCESTYKGTRELKEGGNRSRANMGRTYRRNAPALKYLYNARALVKPNLKKGSLQVWVSIDQRGTVIEAIVIHSMIQDTSFENAVARNIKKWKFGNIPTESDTSETKFDFVFFNDNQISDEDITSILQQTLDHHSIKTYLHTDAPGRVPLYICDTNLFESRPKLTVGGEKVILISPTVQKKNALFIKELTFPSPDRCILKIDYPIEGMRAQVELKKTDQWRVETSRVVEQ